MADEKDPIDEIKETHQQLFKGAGGTQGGCGLFAIGFALSAVGLYLFLDSVTVTSSGYGWFSGLMRRHAFGGGDPGFASTTSMGILFVPFFLGVVILFYNSKLKVGWGLLYLGLGVLVVEIFSRIHFLVNMKLTHLLLMLVMIAAGVGLMLRSFRDESAPKEAPKGE